MEEDIDITLFGDEGEIEVELKARVDTALSISIVSKSLINRLRTKSQPSQGRSVRDSRGKLHAPIGRVDLLWHRKAVPKTNQQTFFVVDSSDEAVIFGANAVPPEDFPSIQPVGLGKQSEGMTQIENYSLRTEAPANRYVYI